MDNDDDIEYKWKFPLKQEFSQNTDSFFNYKTHDLDRKSLISFSKYKGYVCLVVNLATFCDYTNQYLGLNRLQNKYSKKSFKLSVFPAINSET